MDETEKSTDKAQELEKIKQELKKLRDEAKQAGNQIQLAREKSKKRFAQVRKALKR